MAKKKSFICIISFIIILIIFISGLVSYYGHENYINHNYNVGWIKGMPTSNLKHKHIWISQPEYNKNTPQYYYRSVVTLSNRVSYDPFLLNYKLSNHKFINNGNSSSATQGENPYYKKVGYHTYKIVSGTKNVEDDYTMGNRTPTEMIHIKIHSPKVISIKYMHSKYYTYHLTNKAMLNKYE